MAKKPKKELMQAESEVLGDDLDFPSRPNFQARSAEKVDLEDWSRGVLELYEIKKAQYGNSFGASALEFKSPEDTPETAKLRLFCQREFDKLKRINSVVDKTSTERPMTEEEFEIVEDALKDIVGYVYVIKDLLN